MELDQLKAFLDEKVETYNQPSFIQNDPISIPHQFTLKQDVEISGLFAALLAWGQRKTILNKCKELMNYMSNAPFDFVLNHQENDLKPFLNFKHRTFNSTDTLYFIHWLKWYYGQNDSLESAFSKKEGLEEPIMGRLISFYDLFFSLPDHPTRTRKHIQTPAKKSACKRINMYLRWMVRNDNQGVDFGIWSQISMADLICPLDLHVDRVARKLGLITRKQTDWLAAIELTRHLRFFDANDPVKYDFALFALGVDEKY